MGLFVDRWHGRGLPVLAAWLLAIAAYGLYRLVVVPLVEPQIVRRGSPEHHLVTARRTSFDLSPYFPADAWERGQPKILETNHGMLLFGDYQPHADGTLELAPVTLLYFPPNSEETTRVPLIVQAPEGAVLQSDRPINLARGDFGRPLAGRLRGPVTIRRPRSSAGRHDELYITARHVQLERHRLWTPHEVEFRFGPHWGRGKDLRIYFQDKTNPSLDANNLMQVVRQVELIHLDQVAIRWDTQAGQPTSGAASAREPAPSQTTWIELRAAGPFRYFVPERQAMLSERVELVWRLADGKTDRLRCETVELQLDDTLGYDGQTIPVAKRILARGKPLEIECESHQVAVRAELVLWDKQENQLLIESTQEAQVRYGSTDLRAPRIEYRFSSGAIASEMGELRVDGPGSIRGLAGTRIHQPLDLMWTGALRFGPHEGQHLLSVWGRVQCSVENLATFSAERLYLFVKSASSSAKAVAPTSNWVPDRLVALEQVQVDSPWLRSKRPSRELRVWFVASDVAPPTSPVAGQPAMPAAPRTEAVNPALPLATNDPIWFQGDIVEARILDQNGYQLDDITVAGAVEISRTPSRDEQPSFLLRGELLQASRVATDQPRFQVQGSPATAGFQGHIMQGAQIAVDAKLRRLLLVGPGKMLIAPTPGGFGNTPLVLVWTDGLDFDGQLLQLYGQVDISAQPQDESGSEHQLLIRGEHLVAEWDEALEFRAVSTRASSGQVRNVRLQGPIRAEHRAKTADGHPLAIDELSATALEWVHGRGDLRAVGPGFLSSLRPIQILTMNEAAHTPSAQERPDRLVHVQIGFEQELVGNIEHRQVEFRGSVRAYYVPVANWETRYDPARAALGRDGLELSCARLVVAQMPSGSKGTAHHEFLASGNVRVRGESFAASGDRLSYDDLKDLMVLEGTTRSPAVIQTTWGSGSAQARVIRIWPRSRRLQSEGIRGIDFGPIGDGPP